MDLSIFSEPKKAIYYSQVRSEILSLLPESIERTLEIGCGEGNTLTYLKDKKKCTWTAGVEISSQAAKVAKEKLDFLIEGNVELLDLPIEPGTLDLILCLDVMEHLVDPWLAVQRLHRLLKKEGVIIASIPNVRNFRVLRQLILRGEWEYTGDGILDKTHLRFFTKNSAVRLLESSGLKVDMIDVTGIEKGRKTYFFNLITFKLFEPFLVQQYLIRARRVD